MSLEGKLMKEKYENHLFYHIITALISAFFGFCFITIAYPERGMYWYISDGYAFYNGFGFFLIVIFVYKLIRIIDLYHRIKDEK